MIDCPAPAQSSFWEVLRASSGALTPTENILVAYLLKNWKDLPLVKATEIAHDVGVNPSSVTRLAQTLGFRGYPDMQRAVRQELRALHVPQPLPQASSAQVHWDREILLFNQMRHFSDEILDALVNDIAIARRVYIAGARGSAASAVYSAHLWQMIRADVVLLPEDADRLPALWSEGDENDLLVAFTMKRHAVATTQLMSGLVKQGTRLALITDNPIAPEARAASHLLVLPGTQENGGQFVSIAMVNSLTSLLASKLTELLGSDRMASLERYAQEHDLYSF